MVNMQCRTAINHTFHSILVKSGKTVTFPKKSSKEIRILYQSHFDRLNDTGPQITIGQGHEKVKIVDNGERWCKGAQKIFPAKAVDAVFYSHPRIILGQNRCRHPDEAHSPVGSGSTETDNVE